VQPRNARVALPGQRGRGPRDHCRKQRLGGIFPKQVAERLAQRVDVGALINRQASALLRR
jgi:hypothetical protein